MNNDDLPTVILTLVIAALILFIGINAVSAVVDTSSETGQDVESAALLDGTSWAQIDNSLGTQETVYDSRGYAVNLTGANDSYVRTTEDISLNPANDTWTVSTWASRGSTTTENRTLVSVDGEIIVYYDGTTGNWSAWYYDAGSGESIRVNVSAQGTTGDLENVVVVRNNSQLSIYANTTAGDSKTLDGSGTVESPNTTTWDGRIEEIRVVADAWNSTQRQNHYNDPILPITSNMSARIMFDEPYRTDQRLFYNSGDVATSNTSFASGLPGQELDSGSAILAQSDYHWRKDGPQIKAVSGGRLDGAPVAYVDYTKSEATGQLLNRYESAIQLAGLLLVLLPLAAIVSYLYTARNTR